MTRIGVACQDGLLCRRICDTPTAALAPSRRLATELPGAASELCDPRNDLGPLIVLARFGGGREREPSYLSCCRRTISVIQMGANGDVQFGGVG